MTEHAEALEADLLRYYGVDLLDYHRGRLSARRLRVLIQHLPREAAVPQAVHGDDAEWGLRDHLLAAAVDQIATGNWMFATVHAAEGSEPPERPQPVTRPGVTGEERHSATAEQIAAFFSGR